MQLALTFPQAPLPVNNRAMSSDDADTQDAAKKLRNKALTCSPRASIRAESCYAN